MGPIASALNSWLYSATMMKNMGYVPVTIFGTTEILQFLFSVVFVLIYTLYEDVSEEFFAEILAAIGVIYIRIFLISVKYGMLPQKYWNRLKTKLFTMSEVSGTLLLRSWMIIPENVLQDLIDEALQEQKDYLSLFM
jgi:hypothetical protein